MTYSGKTPCVVSPECYTDIETQLELWYNSASNPFRNIFVNAKRMSQKDMTEKFDLVIEDYGQEEGGMIQVSLKGKTNKDYVPFREVFDKKFGCIK